MIDWVDDHIGLAGACCIVGSAFCLLTAVLLVIAVYR